MGDEKSAKNSNVYTVEGGDTIYAIARKIGVSVENLLAANPDLEDPGSIYIGQELGVPSPGMHVVASGDTFSEIAQQYGVTVEALQSVNAEIANIDHIREGQQVRIPLPFAPQQGHMPDGSGTQIYKVQAGDTLSEIAERHGITQDELERLNPQIKDPDKIGIDDSINVPVSSNQSVQPQPTQEPQRSPAGEQKPPADDVQKSSLRRDGRWSQQRMLNASDGHTDSYNVSGGAVDNAWSAVEGRTIQPDFQDVAYDPRPLIVLDPGHGADNESGYNDPGAVAANGLRETDVADAVGLALAERLSAAGYRVAFTRDPGEEYKYSASDGPGRLSSRARFAHALEDQTAAPYTIFISLHANAAGSEAAKGFEVLVDKEGAGRGDRSTASSAASVHLADSVLGRMDGYQGMKNRGLKTYNASVLDTMERGDAQSVQADSSILIEFGFLTNDDDVRIMEEMTNSPGKMADRLFEGINDHVRSREPVKTHEPRASVDQDPPTFST